MTDRMAVIEGYERQNVIAAMLEREIAALSKRLEDAARERDDLRALLRAESARRQHAEAALALALRPDNSEATE